MSDLPAALAALGSEESRLGLRRGSVQVVEHNPLWADLAQGLAAHLRGSLQGYPVKVEHIGSTSVPGLAAKPMLDMAVGIGADFEIDAVVARLEAGGFAYQLDLGMYGGLLFTVNTDTSTVVAHVHVVRTDDFQWQWYLAFRDGLRSNPKLRQQYETLKRSAAVANASNREGYTEAKFEWVLATVSSLSDIGPPPSPPD